MTEKPMLFLAIDQSTSASKALLFNVDGTLVDQHSIPHQQIYPRARWVEHDANEIYSNTLKAIEKLLKRHTDQITNIQALSITNQRETFVLFDQKTGESLHNAIVWQCRRGEELCQQLEEAGKGNFIHEKTGLKIDTYFPASKLRWLLDNYPEFQVALKNGSALFGTMDTYLIYRLTGGKVYATDHTNASRTLFYNIDKLDWSQELCNVFGIEIGKFPEIRESSDHFGDTDVDGLLSRRIPICGVMGDSQAALFAQRCFAPGTAKVTFGTGSSVLMNIGSEKKLSEHGTLTAIGWVWKGKPTFAFEGIVNFTGATITWLRDQLQMITDPSETGNLAQSISDTDGVFFIPAFVGLSAPYWRADVRAAILGITPSTTRAHIVRAALESIGYIITDVLYEMSEEAKVKLDIINADGGATQNTFLMQFVSDLNQLTVRSACTPALSPLGAVLNGCLGLNIYSSLEEIQKLPNIYIENRALITTDESTQLLSNWHNAVDQLLVQPDKRR